MMRCTRIRNIVAAVCLTAIASLNGQEPPLLDLTKPSVSVGRPQSGQTARHRSVARESDRSAPPLKVRLVGFERDRYRDGDPALVDIEIEANEPVTIPWSTDAAAADLSGDYAAPGFQAMNVVL